MKRVTKISTLPVGTKIVIFASNEESFIHEYLMKNPHKDNHVLILDETSNVAISVTDEVNEEVYTDFTILDILAHRLNYYQEMIKKIKLEIQNELSKQKGENK